LAPDSDDLGAIRLNFEETDNLAGLFFETEEHYFGRLSANSAADVDRGRVTIQCTTDTLFRLWHASRPPIRQQATDPER
jgi:hypothetical protein